MELSSLSLAAALDGLRSKAFSSVELTQAILDAIASRDPAIGAYLTVDAEAALAQAHAADAARAAGSQAPLLGVPLAIKDIINVTGQPCTCGSKLLEGYIAPFDATVTAKLRDAGAVFAGRTNMDEFAMGSSNEHSAFKPVQNPAAPGHVPGGSSGGSAAAVAGNMAIAALGTDTGGSIRQPASFCGIVGLKPSYGRVSRFGVTAFASSLDQVGPMTRTVEDSAILLSILAGADPHDQTCLNEPVPNYRAALASASPKGLRIGLPREYFADGADPEVLALVRKAASDLEAAGATLVDVSLPHTEYAVAVYYICAPAEASANLARFDGVRYGARVRGTDSIGELTKQTRSAGFGPEVKRRIILGTYVLSSGYYDAYYTRALKARTLIRKDFTDAFSQCDILLGPVSPTPAPLLGQTQQDPLKAYLGDAYTIPANLAGICGISVPCGTTAAGLPVGLQLLGPALGETQILQAAHAYSLIRG